MPAIAISRRCPVAIGALWLCACGVESRGYDVIDGSGGAAATGGTPAQGGGDGTGGAGVATGGTNAAGGGGSGGFVATGGASSGGGGQAPLDGGTEVPVDGGAEPEVFASRPIASPPTYWGSVDNSAACSREYQTIGFEPDTSASRHPLFLYFVGTGGSYDYEGSRAVTEAMARRGFVSLSVQYDNTWAALISDHESQLECLFAAADDRDLIARACALSNVDCDLGIGTWGHSQGALVAHMAASYDPRVRGAWTTGYGGATEGLFPVATPSTLPKNRFRVVNAEAEVGGAGTVPTLNVIAGFTASDCPDDGRASCLRPDGSGWIIVKRADLASPDLSSADHCWFDRRSCLDAVTALEPNWVDPMSTKPFALESNADWLAKTVRQP